MNKKVEKRNTTNIFLLVVLIMLFCFTLYISLNYIKKFYDGKMPKDDESIIEIKTEDISASIINSGMIKETINSESFGEEPEKIIETINVINITANKDIEKEFKFNVRYNILKNDFNLNNVPSNQSEVLVRFSYSYDGNNWTYVNNVVSTNTSNISSLIGNNYDIAGLITKLNIATDFKVNVNKSKPVKMYWRSETVFKNISNFENPKELNANFTIEYTN